MKNEKRAIELLHAGRRWMWELHGWYWSRKETCRHGPMMKRLIRDIKSFDKFLQKIHQSEGTPK